MVADVRVLAQLGDQLVDAEAVPMAAGFLPTGGLQTRSVALHAGEI